MTKLKKEDNFISNKSLIKSKFGDLEVDYTQSIYCPHGILGMPEMKKFCLAHLPNSTDSIYKVLQSVDNHQLSFITMPINIHNPLIEHQDLVSAASNLQISPEKLAVLLIATVKKLHDNPEITLNLKAPLLIDAVDKVGYQYVFVKNDYSLQYKII